MTEEIKCTKCDGVKWVWDPAKYVPVPPQDPPRKRVVCDHCNGTGVEPAETP